MQNAKWSTQNEKCNAANTPGMATGNRRRIWRHCAHELVGARAGIWRTIGGIATGWTASCPEGQARGAAFHEWRGQPYRYVRSQARAYATAREESRFRNQIGGH